MFRQVVCWMEAPSVSHVYARIPGLEIRPEVERSRFAKQYTQYLESRREDKIIAPILAPSHPLYTYQLICA